MKKLLIFIICMCLTAGICSCKKADDKSDSVYPDIVKGSITFKNFGVMQFELYPNKAPISALNFISLAKSGFYDGIVVHRLIQDFVIQAGAFESGYAQRATTHGNIFGEFAQNGFDNPIPHVRGTLSWARPQAFDGASTQFFICTGDEKVKSLDGGYAAFGMITDGFDVMDAINAQPTDAYDMPLDEIMIESVVIDSDFNFPEPEYVN